jgi:hypothetical protein
MGDRRPYGLQHLEDYAVEICYSFQASNVPDRYIQNRCMSIHVLLAKLERAPYMDLKCFT